MGESRTELLSWLNNLLELNYVKIEQAGTGAAYCQIMDSIYGDIPLEKVNFDFKHEYKYVSNYKILQYVFDKHKIDKIIPVDRLQKCKFKDNLEFMQWIKKYWDQNFLGDEYNATERREGEGAKSAIGTIRSKCNSTVKGHIMRPGVNLGKIKLDPTQDKKMTMHKNTINGLEKERDFYFGKLREIEILVQGQIFQRDFESEVNCIEEIQNILYRTEEGFEIPSEEE